MKLFALGNHLTPYLLGASVVLGGTLALEGHNLVRPQGETTAQTNAPVQAIEHASYSAPALAAFNEITERPLFTEGRLPPEEPVNAPVAVRSSPLRLALEGVAITPGSRIAVVRDLSTNKMLHLPIGMKHQDWELTAVTETDATFERGGQSHTITLKDTNR